ncbi:hypothetical protein [Pedobacter sp. FW305-3-2-15-E-R2A2]|uniref:hypothetical protein n=1 Tax=Pedobacter sp. FW305-3-2-15-E-R2A2 TaxID=3140251 RepID=UPI0031403E01
MIESFCSFFLAVFHSRSFRIYGLWQQDLAPMVASRNNDVKFIVLLAGDGIPLYEVGLQQSADRSRVEGVSETVIAQNLALDKKICDPILQDSILSIGQLRNDIDSLFQQEMLSRHWDKPKQVV